MNEFVDKKFRIGLFDSGIGGFSILSHLFDVFPNADYFYYSDDANAPYGPKTDEFITERSEIICLELFKKNVDLIVVACNTATAASIDFLRQKFADKIFVGVEPYLNAYYKMPEGEKKMAVLTTVSMGRSERFRRLKNRLDPEGKIEQLPLANLAKLIEDKYYHRIDEEKFKVEVLNELNPLLIGHFTHAILGCTHYPLIAPMIEEMAHVETISPGRYVAERVVALLHAQNSAQKNSNHKMFYFCSSRNNQWVEMNRTDSFLSFKM